MSSAMRGCRPRMAAIWPTVAGLGDVTSIQVQGPGVARTAATSAAPVDSRTLPSCQIATRRTSEGPANASEGKSGLGLGFVGIGATPGDRGLAGGSIATLLGRAPAEGQGRRDGDHHQDA